MNREIQIMTYRVRWKKHGNIKTSYAGQTYDSQFEAGIARDLDLRLHSGEIRAWERQYKVVMWACDSTGAPKLRKTHKVDFRISELDDTYTLLEAKGFDTSDYRERRKWLESFWLPDHLDYVYEVIYNK